MLAFAALCSCSISRMTSLCRLRYTLWRSYMIDCRSASGLSAAGVGGGSFTKKRPSRALITPPEGFELLPLLFAFDELALLFLLLMAVICCKSAHSFAVKPLRCCTVAADRERTRSVPASTASAVAMTAKAFLRCSSVEEKRSMHVSTIRGTYPSSCSCVRREMTRVSSRSVAQRTTVVADVSTIVHKEGMRTKRRASACEACVWRPA